jgi:predicted metal-dependent HD superfamily phosphohydrolase
MDVDAPVMVDVDLAILGQPEERFLEYETQIRQEYALVPAATFATKRIEIIERFLARQRIYATDWFYQKYEVAARRNLQMSLKAIRDSCA